MLTRCLATRRHICCLQLFCRSCKDASSEDHELHKKQLAQYSGQCATIPPVKHPLCFSLGPFTALQQAFKLLVRKEHAKLPRYKSTTNAFGQSGSFSILVGSSIRPMICCNRHSLDIIQATRQPTTALSQTLSTGRSAMGRYEMRKKERLSLSSRSIYVAMCFAHLFWGAALHEKR